MNPLESVNVIDMGYVPAGVLLEGVIVNLSPFNETKDDAIPRTVNVDIVISDPPLSVVLGKT